MKLIDEQGIKKNWGNRGFSFGIWIDPPGQIWQDYSHDSDELFMLVDGNVELIIDGMKIIPMIGEEILIPNKAKHTVKNTGLGSSRWYYGYQIPR